MEPVLLKVDEPLAAFVLATGGSVICFQQMCEPGWHLSSETGWHLSTRLWRFPFGECL
jgi:hypothetical protein